MFDIEYKGGNTVIISTKPTTVVVDAKRSVFGQPDVASKDAVQLATEARLQADAKNFRISFEGPGEYEVGEISIKGLAAQRHIDGDQEPASSTVYRLSVGDTRIALLGNIAPKLTEDQLEAVGMVDIVILPVGGGGYTLDATSAAALIRQLEPKVVIPVHYNDAALQYEVPQDELETFTHELGAPVEAVGAKYKVKSASSIPQSLTVVTIDRS